VAKEVIFVGVGAIVLIAVLYCITLWRVQ
jgi:hypothetical protein